MLSTVASLRRRIAPEFVRRAHLPGQIFVQRGIGKYGLLGAGMDTFAYRQPSWVARLRILEIDHPESQKIKREYLVKGGITIPANVEFLPIDFERRSLARASPRTLRFILSMPRRSEIVLEFILPPDSWTPEEAGFLTKVVQMVDELGELFIV